MMSSYKIQFSTPSFELNEHDHKEIGKILASGWVSIGKYTEQLEEVFRQRFNVKHAIGCSNATTGLIIAIKASGIFAQHKAINVPAFTWPSTIYALVCNKNKPHYVDINDNWIMDAKRGIALFVDTFGVSAGKHYNCIYDAAHGFDIPDLGNRGLVEVVSLSHTKVVTACEGGMILTNDKRIANKCYELRRISGRMLEVNAYIGLRSIEQWDKKNKKHRLNLFLTYRDMLKGIKMPPYSHNHSVFSAVLPTVHMRDKVMQAMVKNSIEVKTYYEPMVEGLHNTDKVFSHTLSLPMHTRLASEDIEKIINTVNSCV